MKELYNCETLGLAFAEAYAAALSDSSRDNMAKLQGEMQSYQQQLAKAAGRILTHLILPAWQHDGRSLILESQPSGEQDDEKAETLPFLAAYAHVRAAEEFFVLPYLGFIQNVLGRVRTIAVGMLLTFTATTLAVSSYPFGPAPVIGAIFLVLFIAVGTTVVFAYAQMHRDATLSHITQTRPGELGFEFWTKIFSFGIGPLIGLLTTLFPSVTDFLVSWLQPGAEMLK